MALTNPSTVPAVGQGCESENNARPPFSLYLKNFKFFKKIS